MRRAYLDTCVISGAARKDLKDPEQAGLREILEAVQSSAVTICSSTEARTELDQVPQQYRAPHLNAYSDITILRASTEWLGPTGQFTGVAGETYARLASVLPDTMDARHLTQASMQQVEDSVTTDERTIPRFRDEIRRVTGIGVWTPSEYASSISGDVRGPGPGQDHH